jgi:hypothetical protein
MIASPTSLVRVFETIRGADVVTLRSVRSNAVGARSRDHRAERSSVLGICFWPFIVRQHARPSMAMPLAAALDRASGLVQWHFSDMPGRSEDVR